MWRVWMGRYGSARRRLSALNTLSFSWHIVFAPFYLYPFQHVSINLPLVKYFLCSLHTWFTQSLTNLFYPLSSAAVSRVSKYLSIVHIPFNFHPPDLRTLRDKTSQVIITERNLTAYNGHHNFQSNRVVVHVTLIYLPRQEFHRVWFQTRHHHWRRFSAKRSGWWSDANQPIDQLKAQGSIFSFFLLIHPLLLTSHMFVAYDRPRCLP